MAKLCFDASLYTRGVLLCMRLGSVVPRNLKLEEKKANNLWDAYLSGPAPRNALSYEGHPHSAAVDSGRWKARAEGNEPIAN